MRIQSLSVCVPGAKCINDCSYCVSKMHSHVYPDGSKGLRNYDVWFDNYMRRLEFCRDNECNTIILTGTVEPQQNTGFLKDFGMMMKIMNKPFRNIEMQTTGVLITPDYLEFFKRHVGVNTMAVSVSSFNDEYDRHHRGYRHERDLKSLCRMIKDCDLNLRLCLNLTKDFRSVDVFKEVKKLGADQLTLRVMYRATGSDTMSNQQVEWINLYAMDEPFVSELRAKVETFPMVRQLEYGQAMRSYNGMSVVMDGDCMAKDLSNKEIRYLILRPNARLYSMWDDPTSLVF